MPDARAKAYGVAALVFAADRLTKWLIETRVSLDETHSVIPGFFDIVHSQNRGVAFGIFNESRNEWRTILLVTAAVAAVVMVSVMLWKASGMDRRTVWGLSLVLGGASGNVFDRMLWGRVTDFLAVYIGNYQWPTFNVADSAIVIGSGLLVLDLLRQKRQPANVP
jgi:signal peptidase II